MRRRRVNALALVAALWPSLAAAQTVALVWEAPPGCPDRADVLARMPAAPRPIDVRARSARGANGRWSLHLELDGGVRDLEADTCAELADAAVLLVALALDGAAPAPPPARIPSAPRERLRVGARILGGVDLGTMPAAAFTASLGLTLRHARLFGELSLAWVTSQRAVSNDGVGGAFDAGRVSLRGCGVPLAGRVELRGCAGFDVGWISGVGVGVAAPAGGTAPSVAARVGAEAAWRALPWLAAVVQVDGFAMLARPTFARRDGTTLHAPGPAGALLQMGVEVAW